MHRSSGYLVSLAALVGLGLAAPTEAAVKVTEAFDGNYYNPSTSGRGILLDVTVGESGRRNVFMAQFTYDAEGNPVWLAYGGGLDEHQFKGQLDVAMYEGGSFGFPFSEPTQNIIGSATITFNSCNSIVLDVDMADDSGFADTTFELQPAVERPMCVYREEFSGCPAFASPVDGLDRACALSGTYLGQDVTLTNDITWVLDGLVRFGDDNANASTLRIEPGTVLVGGGGTPYLYISPGSKIFADGKPWAPIVMTSVQDGFGGSGSPSPGDLGGLVVSGNAPANACPSAPFQCFSEFDQTQRFGGDQPHESSGSISYFQVRYAGIEFQPDSEVNAFTFQGVGDGTRVHHIQAYRGADDGVEFFGGTVNVSHVVVTEGGDEAVDWDLGYQGNLQFGLVVHGSGLGEDNGFEGSNNGDNFDAQPRSIPTLANFTMIGKGNGDAGIYLKEGGAGRLYNSVVTGFPTGCLRMVGDATFAAAGTPAAPSGDTVFQGVIFDCDIPFAAAEGGSFAPADLFNAFPGNAIADSGLDGYQPRPGSAARHGGQTVPGDFFSSTEYRGAFSGHHDWTEGWTYRPFGED